MKVFSSLRLPLLIAFFVMGVGCDSSTSDDGSPIVGTWDFVSISGGLGDLDLGAAVITAGAPQSLTLDLGDGPVSYTVTMSGVLTFTASSYTLSINLSFVDPPDFSLTENSSESGTYTAAGSTVTFNPDDPGDDGLDAVHLVISGDTMTITFGETVITLRRR